MVQINNDYIQQALDHRIEQLKHKENFKNLLVSYIGKTQDVENSAIDLKDLTTLDEAFGKHLDNIGLIVGEERSGKDDVLYRTAIAARIKLNLSEGTIENIIGLIRGVAGNVSVKIWEFFPAAFIAQILDPLDPNLIDPETIAVYVKSGGPAGVGAFTTYSVLGAFAYDSGPGFDDGKYGGAS